MWEFELKRGGFFKMVGAGAVAPVSVEFALS